MKYARLKNKELIPAPRTITTDGLTICNPTKEQYLSIGWYEVVTTAPPELPPDAPKMSVPHWEQADNCILQCWDITPIPEPEPEKPPEPTLDQRVGQLEVDNEELYLYLAEKEYGAN